MSATQNVFGTDGIRDHVGQGMLAPAALARLAHAIARTFAHHGQLRVLVGRDTRPSGPAIETQLGAALAGAGCRVDSAGVLPTPAVSLLVTEEDYDLGVVISASHNPPEYNGVKLFDGLGRKLAPADEQRITATYHALADVEVPADGAPPRVLPGAAQRYVERLLSVFPERGFLAGERIVLDCAFGATVATARLAFEEAGAAVTVLHGEPDGERINEHCGSLHPARLAARVVAERARLGVAFDGDGDRAVLVDERGGVVDGDEMLALWAVALAERGALPGRRLVATVMSNAGMESYLRQQGIDLIRTSVGDREVVQELEQSGAVLGGEQSGHIIYLPEARTGDGVRTGLHLARLVQRAGASLSVLRAAIPRFPQTLIGLPVRARTPLEQVAGLPEALREVETTLAGRGRVLVRYSGTEWLVRVLVEGPDSQENQRLAARLGALFGA